MKFTLLIRQRTGTLIVFALLLLSAGLNLFKPIEERRGRERLGTALQIELPPAQSQIRALQLNFDRKARLASVPIFYRDAEEMGSAEIQCQNGEPISATGYYPVRQAEQSPKPRLHSIYGMKMPGELGPEVVLSQGWYENGRAWLTGSHARGFRWYEEHEWYATGKEKTDTLYYWCTAKVQEDTCRWRIWWQITRNDFGGITFSRSLDEQGQNTWSYWKEGEKNEEYRELDPLGSTIEEVDFKKGHPWQKVKFLPLATVLYRLNEKGEVESSFTFPTLGDEVVVTVWKDNQPAFEQVFLGGTGEKKSGPPMVDGHYYLTLVTDLRPSQGRLPHHILHLHWGKGDSQPVGCPPAY